MGHAMDETMQDILIRFKRMQGYCALWLPGTDHASIATEVKIVDQLKKEGLSKEELGREEFLKRAWAWKEKYGGRIAEQLKKLGSSCDWSRLAFTMDEKCSKGGARGVFPSLSEGIDLPRSRINQLVPELQDGRSPTRKWSMRKSRGHFWYFAYPVEGSDGEDRHRNHPPRDDARRYGGGRSSGGQAVCFARRKDAASAADRPQDPRRGGRVRRSRIRDGRP